LPVVLNGFCRGEAHLARFADQDEPECESLLQGAFFLSQTQLAKRQGLAAETGVVRFSPLATQWSGEADLLLVNWGEVFLVFNA